MAKKKKLVVVESPNKIKKIQKFLGSDYIVKASVGHIVDLPRKGLGIDIKNGFTPEYKPLPKKKDAILELKKAAKKADEVFLACDKDREGEQISQSVKEILEKTNKNLKFHRVRFNEITKAAVTKAFANPSTIDNALVEAQKARRILDRLTGFKISPMLWRKGKDKEKISRSAGRVQSVGLQIIVDRQKEIDVFVPVKYWTIEALVSDGADEFVLGLVTKTKFSIDSEEKAKKYVKYLKGETFIVDKVAKKTEKKKPLTPFTTSTLQQATSSIHNWSAKKTMTVAQKLYEGGHITYMRTDSIALSQEAVDAIRTLIPKITSKKYLPSKAITYKSRGKNAQEAHECIRPTNLEDDLTTVLSAVSGDEAKLLEIIWRRTVAAQMAHAVFDKVEVLVKAGKAKLKATGQVQTFDGYLKIWTYTETKENVLPELEVGQELTKIKIEDKAHETKPPPRYNEASLVKELEASGVGRPSTYAAIIDTLLTREYVKKDGKAFVPTDVGIEVSDFLKNYFKNIINVGFTSQMEEDLDKIAAGDKTRLDLLTAFYKELKETINQAKVQLATNEVAEEPCPACGSPLFIKLNRKEKQRFFSCSNKDCRKTYDMDSKSKPHKREVEKLDEKCPECGSDLIKKKGPRGEFYGCAGYKEHGCRVTADLDGIIRLPPKDTGRKCKKCKKGTMVERTNKASGDKFLGCSAYPKCRNTESVEED